MNKFRLTIILQIGIIILTCFGFAFAVTKTEAIFVPIAVCLLLCAEVYYLFRYIESINEKLSTFLDAIRHSDFTNKIEVKDLGQSFYELENKFNNVLDEFQNAKLQSEQNLQFLQTIFQHIDVGLIAFEKDGTIAAKNTAFSNLTKTHSIASIHQLSTFDKQFGTLLMQIQPGNKQLFKTQIDDTYIQLTVYATSIQVNNDWMKLVSIQNIQTELDDKELDTWQKLIRVLTHEIMNSIAPITSLSSTLLSIVPADETTTIDKETAIDITTALQSINKRSKHLSAFVDKYREMTKIPQPDVSKFLVADLFSSITDLLSQTCTDKNIALSTEVAPDSLEIIADKCLLEQVLINLLNNSIQALDSKNGGTIQLIAKHNRLSKIEIQIIDNGSGIMPEVLEKVFIPFYTTKPEGSGIGLSLSRQIIKKHGGSLNIYSKKDEFTKAVITF